MTLVSDAFTVAHTGNGGGSDVPEIPDVNNLADLMREACAIGPTPDEAVNVAREWLRQSPQLFDLLVEPMVRAALRRYAHEARHNVNRVMRTAGRRSVDSGEATPADVDSAYRAALTTAPAVIRSVLEISTPLGPKIGDCVGTDLFPIAEDYREQGRGKFAMATLCERLGSMAREHRVRDVVDAAQANRIYRSIIAE